MDMVVGNTRRVDEVEPCTDKGVTNTDVLQQKLYNNALVNLQS